METEWWDYVEQKYVRANAPTDDATALRFMPQLPAAKGLYQVRRELGDTILEAMAKTLKACVGKTEQKEADSV